MSVELDAAKEVARSVSFIDTLGLNWKLFIAQLVNFSVIVFVLWRWMYRPLVQLMDKRTKKIEQSLEDAKRIERDLHQLDVTKNTTLRDARIAAQGIIEEATKKGEVLRQELLLRAHTDGEKVLHDTKIALAREKEQMLTDVKAHVADLVVAAAEKILQEKIDWKKDKELVEATVSKISR